MEALGVNRGLDLLKVEHVFSEDASLLAPAGDSGMNADP